MRIAKPKINQDIAALLCRSLIMRHDMDEYAHAAIKSSVPNESRASIRRRAKICHERTDFEGRRMDFGDPKSLVVREHETDKDCWRIGWLIDPIEFKHCDGVATPVYMNISKTTGNISDLWVEISF